MSKAIRFAADSIVNGRIGTSRIHAEIAGAASRLVAPELPKLDRALAQMIEQPKRSKYRNRPCEVAGIMFDSEKEANRYLELKARLDAGELSELRLQVPFEIAPAVELDGEKRRARFYVADFVYRYPNGSEVVEDAKGYRTEMYRLKRHLMKDRLGIEVQEV